jgi:N-acetyl-gamma-glutamyl-phosphate/LysW-gamma-L-alpha-aminoadipyl-6-phosphate reductase
VKIAFSPHSVNIVRGILSTIHAFIHESLTSKDVWNFYRRQYVNEPFIRIVRYKKGLYRYPNPKVVFGTNFCDIGFEMDSNLNRLVVLSALDNMMKGSAGMAIQCLNILLNLDERTGLEFVGFHPG